MTGLSRRKSTQAILDGRIKIDGQVEFYPRRELDPAVSKLTIDDTPLQYRADQKVVYLLNKPAGVLSAMTDDRGRKTLADLIEGRIKERVFHVGRLDQGTSGIIIMTNDGDLANLISHPSSEIRKTYIVKIKGSLKDEELQLIRNGITLQDGFTTSPADAYITRRDRETTTLRLTISEGHKREIREMLRVIGKRVQNLVRVSIGGLHISLVPNPGDIKKLSKKEVELLKKKK